MNTVKQQLNKTSHNLIDGTDIKKSISLFLKNWYIFVILVGLGAGMSLLYFYKATKYYGATSTILIKPKESMLQMSQEKPSPFEHKPDISNEILIITSRNMIDAAIEKLDIDISYQIVGHIKTGEVYNGNPFKVDGKITNHKFYNKPFNIKILNSQTCHVWQREEDGKFNKIIRFGVPVITPQFTFIVNGYADQINSNPDLKNINYQFIFNNRDELVESFKERLKVEKITDASAIKIEIEDPVAQKAVDFLDTLTNLYIENAISVNKLINEHTIEYLDNEINYIESMLSTSESELVNFQSKRTIIDPQSQQLDVAKRASDFESERTRLSLNLKTINTLYDYLTSDDNANPISPGVLSNQDPSIVKAFDELYTMQQLRNNMLFGNTPNSPAVKEMDQRIAQSRQTIIGTVLSLRKTMVEQINNLNAQIGQTKGELAAMPGINRGLVSLQRNRDVNEKIYLFLLETRTHSMIARAGIVSDKSILEPSKSEGVKRPLALKVFASGIGVGLAFTFLLIFLRAIYFNYVNTKEDIKEVTNLPIIGVIAKAKEAEKDYLVVDKFPQSLTSEAFRVIRTNLSFYSSAAPCKVVVVTSTIASEGKTFTAVNTGTILALSKKKVVLVDLDLHKPKQANAFNMQNDVGVTTYVVGKNTLKEVIKKSPIEGLDLILSGPRTPNASELILDPKMSELIEELKKVYDYILLDSPPVGLLSDARELMRYADVTLYVMKAGYSKKEFVEVAQQVVDTNQIKHLGIVLNAVNPKNVSAGYGGGYYK